MSFTVSREWLWHSRVEKPPEWNAMDEKKQSRRNLKKQIRVSTADKKRHGRKRGQSPEKKVWRRREQLQFLTVLTHQNLTRWKGNWWVILNFRYGLLLRRFCSSIWLHPALHPECTILTYAIQTDFLLLWRDKSAVSIMWPWIRTDNGSNSRWPDW